MEMLKSILKENIGQHEPNRKQQKTGKWKNELIQKWNYVFKKEDIIKSLIQDKHFIYSKRVKH